MTEAKGLTVSEPVVARVPRNGSATFDSIWKADSRVNFQCQIENVGSVKRIYEGETRDCIQAVKRTTITMFVTRKGLHRFRNLLDRRWPTYMRSERLPGG